MSESAPAEVIVERPHEGVALVRLNRPEATYALSLSLQALLSETFTALSADDDVRCIVLTGGEQVFAAGGDIKGLQGPGPIDILQRHTERVWAPIERCPKPIIAAVCGYAFGGGAELGSKLYAGAETEPSVPPTSTASTRPSRSQAAPSSPCTATSSSPARARASRNQRSVSASCPASAAPKGWFVPWASLTPCACC